MLIGVWKLCRRAVTETGGYVGHAQAQNVPTQAPKLVVMWGGIPEQRCVLYTSNLCPLCLSL